MEKKSKKKSEANSLKEVSDCKSDDGFKLSKEVKRKKKDKKNAGFSGDADLEGTLNEDTYVKCHAEAGYNYPKEKEKKKKKRRLEPAENNDEANNEIQMAGEEISRLQTEDGEVVGRDSKFEAIKEKKRHKGTKKEDKVEHFPSPTDILKDKDMKMNKEIKKRKSSQEDNIAETKNEEECTDKKENKKGRRVIEVGQFKGIEKTTAAEAIGKVVDNCDVDVTGKIEKKKKKKKDKKRYKNDKGAGVKQLMTEELGNFSTIIRDKDFEGSRSNAHTSKNKVLDGESKEGYKCNWKKPNCVETGSEDLKPKSNCKKVSFTDHVEVFPSSDNSYKEKEKDHEKGLVQGKRFSREEDMMIKEAVFNYIQAHGLGEEGLKMVLHCKSYPKLKYCWREIGAVLPHRPYTSIYYRAHILFERDEKRSWTKEELELVKRFYEQYGPKWRELADALGKHRLHLKDAWRRIRLPNLKKGHWSQEEYQTLFDLVNMDLRMKASEEKKSKHGMLRDNISWTAISDKLSTRTNAMCCRKWYNQLTSPMVAQGIWADADDYRLLDALYRLDSCCIEDVDWDNLLDHRSGDTCRKRWNQMVHHLGQHGNKSFAEQVEVLSKRYCLDVLEPREVWDNKPVVS